MKTRFDMESDIMNCWALLDDVKLLAKLMIDTDVYEGMPPELQDKLSNQLFGISEVADMRFHKLWDTFLQVNKLNEYNK